MIPVAWIDRLEEDLFEALAPVWYAPAACWLACWIFWRMSLVNAHSA